MSDRLLDDLRRDFAVDVCPVCRAAPKMTAVATGEQACADPSCSAAHGYAPKLAPGVFYDGKTAEQCLDLYTKMQQEEPDPDDSWGCARIKLTATQKDAARELWSLQLRAKVKESAELERNVVRCEIQDVEELTW